MTQPIPDSESPESEDENGGQESSSLASSSRESDAVLPLIELAEWQCELNAETARLQEAEQNLARRERRLQERESFAQDAESVVAQKERFFYQVSAEYVMRLVMLFRGEIALDEREKRILEKEIVLQEKEQLLTEREAMLDVREKSFQAQINESKQFLDAFNHFKDSQKTHFKTQRSSRKKIIYFSYSLGRY